MVLSSVLRLYDFSYCPSSVLRYYDSSDSTILTIVATMWTNPGASSAALHWVHWNRKAIHRYTFWTKRWRQTVVSWSNKNPREYLLQEGTFRKIVESVTIVVKKENRKIERIVRSETWYKKDLLVTDRKIGNCSRRKEESQNRWNRIIGDMLLEGSPARIIKSKTTVME